MKDGWKGSEKVQGKGKKKERERETAYGDI